VSRALLSLAFATGLLRSAASAQGGVSVSLLISSQEHRVDAGFGMVNTRGWVLGAMVGVGLASHLRVQVTATSGTLTTPSNNTDNEDVADVSALVQWSPAAWVSFNGFGSARSATTPLARQHWTSAGLGADLRMPLIGSATEGFLRLNVPLLVSVSGLAAPSVSVEGGAGLRYRQGRFLGQLTYGLLRYDFPPAAGRTRLEEISTLTIGAGLLFGR